jgi:uncharacterized membrane-anchored protein
VNIQAGPQNGAANQGTPVGTAIAIGVAVPIVAIVVIAVVVVALLRRRNARKFHDTLNVGGDSHAAPLGESYSPPVTNAAPVQIARRPDPQPPKLRQTEAIPRSDKSPVISMNMMDLKQPKSTNYGLDY